ncbi:MAG: polyketide cyclase, partial [Delftia sp.]|nr:polyketide cyclase [Delftia sp.]
MSQPPKNAHPAVARSLQLWHRMVAASDLGELHTIVHPDAVFRSPMA